VKIVRPAILWAFAILIFRALFWQPGAIAGDSPHPPSKPLFLVASRDMPDPVFQQGVILMLPPEQLPLVAGVIINKPTDVKLSQLFKQPVALENRAARVYFGGPVETDSPLLLIKAAQPPPHATQLMSGVFSVSDLDTIADILRDGRYAKSLRLFLGRAQWTTDQLHGELLDGAWAVVPVQTDLIFDQDPEKVWPALVPQEHMREVGAVCADPYDSLLFNRCTGKSFLNP
jgi:putative transcriptional regulator